MLGRASLAALTRDARDISEFGRWVDHFEQNDAVHARTGSAIDFGGHCGVPEAVRRPLTASVRRFQLGESGDGEQLLRKAQRAGDPEYLCAARLFVTGATVRSPTAAPAGLSRRTHEQALVGRTELMALTVAEVVAFSYYGGLAADGREPVVCAVDCRCSSLAGSISVRMREFLGATSR
jgi:hypothetical protein